MERCYNTEALNNHLQEQEDSDAEYEHDIQVAKELLGIDMEDDGLCSVIDCLSRDGKHQDDLLSRIGLLIFADGGLMDASEPINAKEFIEQLVFEDDDFMEELAYCAMQKPNFAQRVSDKSKPEQDAPDDY